MMYAMVANSRVIDVLDNIEQPPQWPDTPEGYTVEAVLCDSSVEIGMYYDHEKQEFSVYVDTETDLDTDKPQLDRIEEKLDIIAKGSVNQELEQYYATVNAALNGGV